MKLKSLARTAACFFALTASSHAFALDNQPSDAGQIVGAISAAIEEQYPMEAEAKALVATLQALAAEPDLAAMSEAALIREINSRMWLAAHDLHLKLHNARSLEARAKRGGMKKLPKVRRVVRARGDSPAPLGETKLTGRLLDNNIGLLDFSSAIYNAPDVFAAALDAVAGADAVVIDLRNVPGGSNVGVRAFLSHFFSTPTHYATSYSRQFSKPMQLRTEPNAYSARFGDVPLYVLTNDKTASGAESTAFALKNTGRATLVGARTAGAGNAGAFMEVGGGLTLFLPLSQTRSPQTDTAWEGLGIEPHIVTDPEAALEAALADIAG